MALLPAIEFETHKDPDSVIIWLHGLGADGNDFAPIVPELKLPAELGIRFVFPHAPQIPVTINGGVVMPAWYDILEMEIDRKVDIDQLMASATAISGFIDREIDRGVAGKRILLAGFSQGGAVAYQVALSSKWALGGLLAMSAYFATGSTIEYESANRDLAVEVHHGLYDPVVPEKLGRQAVAKLKSLGYKINYRTYPMEHNVCPEQIADISSWIKKMLQ